jgi:Phospholipase_D-nuclease N-terminal
MASSHITADAPKARDSSGYGSYGEALGYGWLMFVGIMATIVATVNFIPGIGEISNLRFYVAGASYPLLDVFWTERIVLGFSIWIWVLFTVFADLSRRDDVSGRRKAAWIIFVIVLPYLGGFVYLIAEHKGMTGRTVQREAAKSQMGQYVRSVARRDPTEQIAKGEVLLKQGTISQAEFDHIKQRALASA